MSNDVTSPDRDGTLLDGSRSGWTRIRRVVWRIVRLPLIASLVVVMVAMFLENRLIYFPISYPAGNWDEAGDDIKDVFFQSKDGVRLHGWYLRSEEARATVLFFHGNAGNVSYRIDRLRALRDDQRINLFAIDYRGYGRSQGEPSEAGILLDAQAALDWLAADQKIPKDQVVLMGRSLGGAVAVDLASRVGSRALILESTFSSMPDVGASHYPWLPVRLIMRTKFDSLAKIRGFHGALLQSHSQQDQVVPYASGKKLFDAAPGQRKTFVEMDGLDHNDPQTVQAKEALSSFLDSL